MNEPKDALDAAFLEALDAPPSRTTEEERLQWCKDFGVDPAVTRRVGTGGGAFGAMAQARCFEQHQQEFRNEEAMQKAVSSTVQTVAQLLAMSGAFKGLRIELSLIDPEGERELGRESCVVGEAKKAAA